MLNIYGVVCYQIGGGGGCYPKGVVTKEGKRGNRIGRYVNQRGRGVNQMRGVFQWGMCVDQKMRCVSQQ